MLIMTQRGLDCSHGAGSLLTVGVSKGRGGATGPSEGHGTSVLRRLGSREAPRVIVVRTLVEPIAIVREARETFGLADRRSTGKGHDSAGPKRGEPSPRWWRW